MAKALPADKFPVDIKRKIWQDATCLPARGPVPLNGSDPFKAIPWFPTSTGGLGAKGAWPADNQTTGWQPQGVTMQAARFAVFLCAVAALFTGGVMFGLQPKDPGPGWLCLGLALVLFVLDLVLKQHWGPVTTVTFGGAHGLAVGDTVLVAGERRRILKMTDSTITWRRV